jgi:hypothetical protein
MYTASECRFSCGKSRNPIDVKKIPAFAGMTNWMELIHHDRV